MRRIPYIIFIAASQFLQGQQTVAPTDAPVGTPRGENVGGYNIVNSVETGYRFSDIHGNLGKYRSDVNYRNGLRLLGSNLTVNSKEGQGGFFDEIVLNTIGLGNDPYQFAALRVQKNRLYRYDLLWRLDEYYNPGLTVASGEHLIDTRRRLQDHDFTLLPQSKIKFRLGYTRNSQDGPALITEQQFEPRGDEFALFAGVRRWRNEFRVGGDIELLGAKLSWLRAWDNFKEDTPYTLGGSGAGDNPADQTTLSRLTRAEPYHGNTPLWRVNLTKESKVWMLNGRFTYAGGRRNFVFDESALGTARLGADRNRQIVVTGNARRPVTTGDFSISVFPSRRLTVVNNTSVYSTRIDGDASYVEFNNATRSSDIVYFRYLGMRVVTNSTDLHYRVSQSLGFYGGYHFSTREIRSIENFNLAGFGADGVSASQDNRIHSGLFGLRWKPLKPLTLNLDSEIGRASRPFFPISERNYHALGARLQYKARSLLLSTSYKQNYNNNSISISAHSSRARNYSADASWTPRAWFALDASYCKLHLDTLSGIAFFADSALITGRQSIYISNIHVGNLGARFTVAKRVDLYAGYTVTQDAGNGPAVSSLTEFLLDRPQTFPLRFESPLARVSIALNRKLRWNLGWQYYRYREDFHITSVLQDYRATTGYSSLLWSF